MGRWGVPFVQFLLLHTFNLSASPVPPSAPPRVLPLSSLLNLSPFFPEPPSLTNFHCLYRQLSLVSFPSFIPTSSGCSLHLISDVFLCVPASGASTLHPGIFLSRFPFHPNLSLFFHPGPPPPPPLCLPVSPFSCLSTCHPLLLCLILSVSLHLWLSLPLHLSRLCHPLSFFCFSSVPPSPYCPSPSLPLCAHPPPTG